MYIYLPVAEISIPAESVLLLGGIVGFLSGVFGVGGGFLTTPFLIFMGIPPAVAVGTQTNQLVASSVAGSIGHWRRGNVDFKIGLIMMAGGIGGSIVGIGIFTLLQWLGQVDLAISILYIVLLGGIGIMMLTESIWAATHKKTVRDQFNTQKVSGFIAKLPYKMRFPRSKLYISALVPGGIGFVGGILASVMGIGGGFLLVPAMIYILGMSTIVAAGTSLFQIIFTTAVASLLHAVINGTVDLLLAILLIIGGVIGTQIGVHMGRSIKPSHARMTLAILVLLVSLQLSYNMFVRPAELYSTVLW
ncbi:MAG: sulfite exporter TauE/SafE family protein [Alphaproteobacteria bacterium]|nr:sulfite exporter TauE/SafE family protein [Alphaproteobacteria bacterium]MCD8571307.1 sulfite exporter TauE/SafE family protein [Alphaproteobacteria bacterium]